MAEKIPKRKYNYCVLYTQALRQWEVCEVIRKALPEGHGTVFYPCVELWWNAEVGTVIRPLFPGYVFIRSDLGRAELHDLILRRRQDILSFVKELKLWEQKTAGGAALDADDGLLIDLREEEADFLDFMLNFKYEEAAAGDGSSAGENVEAEKRVKSGGRKGKARKIPEAGVIRMSYGYCEEGRYVVMEGPLKGYEDWIVSVDRRKRKAYLNIKINGHMAKAGLEVRGKGYWYPKDKSVPVTLEDGTEINPAEIAKKMMAGRR